MRKKKDRNVTVGSKELLFVQVLGELTPALEPNLSEMGLKSHPFTCLICNHVHLTEESDRKKEIIVKLLTDGRLLSI